MSPSKAQERGPSLSGSQLQHQGCDFIKIHFASSAGRQLAICPGRHHLPSGTPSTGTVLPSQQDPFPHSSRVLELAPWRGWAHPVAGPLHHRPVLDSVQPRKAGPLCPSSQSLWGLILLWRVLHLICMRFIKYKHAYKSPALPPPFSGPPENVLMGVSASSPHMCRSVFARRIWLPRRECGLSVHSWI